LGEKHATLGLGEQVVAIDRARAALAAGDAPRAVRLVDDYEANFPTGTLAQEATALRIEALVTEGQFAHATEVADRFLASHPASPHAARIRRLIRREPNL
jgi:outer membrane protein assembly factor BamD (BamD/ComL family)